MKMRTFVFAAALLAAAAAQAQPPAPSAEHLAAREAVHKACDADSKSLCGEKQGREMFACLRSNADKLSAGCKDALSKVPPAGGPPPAH
jgi:hypothetical protein